MSTQNPTRAGQAVTHLTNGRVGITTDEPRKRSRGIPVMWLGAPYAVLEDPAKLDVIPSDAVRALIERPSCSS